jgi:hypothetical protein
VPTNAKSVTPETAVAATDRFAFGDASADGWAVIQAQKLAKALADVCDNLSALRAALGLGSLAVVTPTGTPDGTKFLRDDGTWQAVAGGGMEIGGTVAGGTAGRVLYVGTGPVLADDSGMTYDAAANVLTLTGGLTLADGANTRRATLTFLDASGAVRIGRSDHSSYMQVQVNSASAEWSSFGGADLVYSTSTGTVVLCGRTDGAVCTIDLNRRYSDSNPAVGGTVRCWPKSGQTVPVLTAVEPGAGTAYTTAVMLDGTIRMHASSSTTAARPRADVQSAWADSTDSTRLGRLTVSVYSAATAQEGFRVEANSGGVRLGFFGGAAVAKPTGVAVTAAGIHAALVSLGLISA